MSDLDEYGRQLFVGDLAFVKDERAERLHSLIQSGMYPEEAHAIAGKEQAKLRWGRTRIPIYQVLLMGSILLPEKRRHILAVLRWLIDEAKVPVGGTDIAGTTTLMNALSTRSAVDLEFVEILYNAGEDVNHRDRYGCTVAHDICMVAPDGVREAKKAIEWFLSHGGNLEVMDNDGVPPRLLLQRTGYAYIHLGPKSFQDLLKVVGQEDMRRMRLGARGCTFCGRRSENLLACSKCKQVRYCPPPSNCQLGDWALHKTRCATLFRANIYGGTKIPKPR